MSDLGMTPRRLDCPDEESWSELLDGELDPVLAAHQVKHLETCSGCRQVLSELRALREGLSMLRDAEVPAALFTRVAARARRERRLVLGLWTGLVGCGCVAVLTLLLIVSSHVSLQVEVPSGRPPSVRASAEAELAKAELHYQNALGLMQSLVEEEKQRWPSSRQAAFEADVRILGRAVQENRRLVGLAPEDSALRDLLFASYRAQIEYLREVLSPRTDDAI